MLAMGRALMARPKLLLLDEPSLGLAPFLVRDIFQIIRDINAQGTTVLLVEQNAHMALGVAHRGYVLETGTIVMADEAKALLANDAVKKSLVWKTRAMEVQNVRCADVIQPDACVSSVCEADILLCYSPSLPDRACPNLL